MNCYLPPRYYCDDLNKLIASFWWNDIEGEKRTHWLSWEKFCISKSDDGLGLQNLYAFNLSLLAKQGWRIPVNPNSLVSRVLKAKYFLNDTFLEVEVTTDASYFWKSICAARNILSLGSRWQVGSSTSLKFWEVPWIPLLGRFRIFTPKPVDSSIRLVSELIDPTFNSWKLDLVSSLFSESKTNAIWTIPLSICTFTDLLTWHYEKDEIFSVRSAFT
ncbi:uncharacterized mitochondrial protein AtMg00310-like [Malus sylvestris]|uniref:uncharacterized mitochondrial protein AtMg00310-like n=1 Tax=Malus sylvestris TaxID=3752 RepID=UPI0021AC220B|nr:uncharacterized mitochondrial protein AtMg00310-like [Malus sylvestris]